jgi:hypothetical protein
MTRLTRRALALVSIVGGLLGVASPALADPPDPAPTTPSTSASTSAPPASPPPTIPTAPSIPVPDQVPVLTGRAGDLLRPPDAGTAPAALGTPTFGDSTVRTGLAGDPATTTDGPPTSVPVASPTNPVAPASGQGPDGSHHRQPPSGAGTPAAGPSPAAAPGASPQVAAGASPVPPATATYVVAPGDSLWTVSAAHLAAMTNQPAGSVPDGAVASYWHRVCAANQPRILSGNVNLIFPGEQIDLPPVGP